MTLLSPVDTGEFSIFAGILNATLSQHHLLAFEIEIINAKLSLLFNKISYLIFSLREGNLEYSNYCTIALISHASKVMLKILQARLQ